MHTTQCMDARILEAEVDFLGVSRAVSQTWALCGTEGMSKPGIECYARVSCETKVLAFRMAEVSINL